MSLKPPKRLQSRGLLPPRGLTSSLSLQKEAVPTVTATKTAKKAVAVDRTPLIARQAIVDAYRALNIPLWDRGEVLLGTLCFKDHRVAVEAVLQRVRRDDQTVDFFDYADYLHAARSVGSWGKARQTHEDAVARAAARMTDNGPLRYPLQSHEDWFVDAYRRSRHTSDWAGYLRYLSDATPHYVTRILETPQPVALSITELSAHAYLVADTESGKSEFLKAIVHSLVHRTDTAVIVLDPNGDLARQIAQWREFAANDRLVYLDYKLGDGQVPIINPFEIEGVAADDYSDAAVEEKRVVIEELCATFEMLVASSFEAFASDSMKLVLRQSLTLLVNRPGSTLHDLLHLMDDEKNGALVAFAARLQHPLYQTTREFFARFVDSHKLTKTAIIGRLDRLFGGALQQMTCGKSTIKLGQLIKERKVIVCNVSKNSMSEYDGPAFGRFVMTAAQSLAKRNAAKIPNKEDRYPCYIIADECHNFISPAVEEILVEARKYRLILTLCQQLIGYKMPRQTAKVVASQPKLKIGGLANNHQLRSDFASFMGVEPAEYNLDLGEFWVSLRGDRKIRVRGRTDLLDENNAMPAALWALAVKRQLCQYYTAVSADQLAEPPIVASTPPPASEPKSPPRAGPKRRKRRQSFDDGENEVW